MKKLVIALICVLVLTGCGSGAGDGPQQSDLPVETSNTPGVYDGEITREKLTGTGSQVGKGNLHRKTQMEKPGHMRGNGQPDIGKEPAHPLGQAVRFTRENSQMI